MITYIINKTTSLEKSACAISLGILGTIIWNMVFDILQPQQRVLVDFSPEQLLILGNPRQFEVLIFTIGILGFLHVFNVIEKYSHRKLKKFYKKFLVDRNEQIPPTIKKEETKPLSYTWDIDFFYDEIPILKRDFQSFVSMIYLIITIIGGIVNVILLIFLQYPNFLLRYFIGELAFLVLTILLLISILRSLYPQRFHNLKRIGLLSLHAYYGKIESLQYAKNGSWLFLQQEVDSNLKQLDREIIANLNRNLNEFTLPLHYNTTKDFWNMILKMCSIWETFDKNQKMTSLEGIYRRSINFFRGAVPLHNFYKAIYSGINKDKSSFKKSIESIQYVLNHYVKTYPQDIFLDLFNPSTWLIVTEKSHLEFWKLNEHDCDSFIKSYFSDIIKSAVTSLEINDENERSGLEMLLKFSLSVVIRQFQAYQDLKNIVKESRRLIEKEKKAILPYRT